MRDAEIRFVSVGMLLDENRFRLELREGRRIDSVSNTLARNLLQDQFPGSAWERLLFSVGWDHCPVRLFVRDNDPKLQKSITAFEGLVAVDRWRFEGLEVEESELLELLLRLGRLPSAHPD